MYAIRSYYAAVELGMYQENVRAIAYDMKYDQLYSIWNKVNQENFVEQTSKYKSIVSDNPWFTILKDNLSDFDLMRFVAESSEITKTKNIWKGT